MHEVQRLISTGLRDIHNWITYERIIYARVAPRLWTKCLQLFQERLSGKVLETIPKGIVGSFEFIVPSKKFERMAREAMDVCLRVLKESIKSRFDSYFIMSDPILPFGIVACTLFFDNLSLNSCIQKVTNRGLWFVVNLVFQQWVLNQ